MSEAPLRVLVICETSGVVREAFRKLGHYAWSLDIEPADDDGNHIQMDALEYLEHTRVPSDIVIAHPPCTYLTNSGVRWLHEEAVGDTTTLRGLDRWEAMEKAAKFFNYMKAWPTKHLAIENPIPHKYAREWIGEYDEIVQPWQFGHGETKATCLWLYNLPQLIPTEVVSGREGRIHNMAPGPERSKERSKTYEGIAEAMAEQWSEYALASRRNR